MMWDSGQGMGWWMLMGSVWFVVFWGIVIWAVVRLTSPGPAIFRQVRCGLNGRQFLFYKFRSMCHDAEARKAHDEQGWITSNPCVPRVGERVE